MANHPPLNRTRKMVNSDSPPPICFFVPFFLMHRHLIFSGLLPGTKHEPNWMVGTGSELIQFGNTAPPPVLLGTPWRAEKQPLLQSCWGPRGEPGPARAAERPHESRTQKGLLTCLVYISLRNTLTGMLGRFHMESLQCNSLIFAWMTKMMLLLLLIPFFKIDINVCFGAFV